MVVALYAIMVLVVGTKVFLSQKNSKQSKILAEVVIEMKLFGYCVEVKKLEGKKLLGKTQYNKSVYMPKQRF
jgi:hypothetical protein